MAVSKTRSGHSLRGERQAQAEIDVVNRAELRANAQQVLQEIHASRPKNTTVAYRSKQEEFKVRF